MRVISWNLRRAQANSPVWDYLLKAAPDIALLQEVGAFPKTIYDNFAVVARPAIKRHGMPQSFVTAVISRYPIAGQLELQTDDTWVQEQARFFHGNLVGTRIAPPSSPTLNVVSVYSPAWEVRREKWEGMDMSHLKLAANPEIWCTEILWDLLRKTMPTTDGEWIVGGDFNSSETLDFGRKGDRGNREIIARMNALGLVEVLRTHHGKLVPTFQNPAGKKVIHQIDHIYVSTGIADRLIECGVCPEERVFGVGLSDHLPIIAEFGGRQQEDPLVEGVRFEN